MAKDLNQLAIDGLKRIFERMIILHTIHGDSKSEEWYNQQRTRYMLSLKDDIVELRKELAH